VVEPVGELAHLVILVDFDVARQVGVALRDLAHALGELADRLRDPATDAYRRGERETARPQQHEQGHPGVARQHLVERFHAGAQMNGAERTTIDANGSEERDALLIAVCQRARQRSAPER